MTKQRDPFDAISWPVGNGNGTGDACKAIEHLAKELHRVRLLLERLAEKPPTDGVFR